MRAKLPILPLAGTLGLGILIGFALEAVITPPPGGNPTPPSQGGVIEASAAAADAGSDQGALHAELLALRAELEALRAAPARTPLDSYPPPEGAGVTLEAGSRDLFEALLREYSSEAFASALEARAAQDGIAAVGRSLFNEYTSARRPRDAQRVLELVERLSPDTVFSPWELASLAILFADTGDRGRAAALYGRALAAEPLNFEFAECLAKLDPAAGVTLLLEANADSKLLEEPAGRYNMARLLLAAGDLDGAIAALRGPDGTIDPSGWELYLEHAPERALADLRSAAKDDPYGTLGLKLARYLGEHDKADEALGTLETLLALNPGNLQALDYLAELAPERALELYQERLESTPRSADLWRRYAEQLHQLGRTDQAVEAGLEAFRLGSDTWPADYLVEAAPDEVLSCFEQRVEGSLDDELWGDYGDTLWRAGHAEEARAAWERARSIDGDDGEWIGKLKALKAGKSPFGEDEPGMPIDSGELVIFD